MNVQIQNPKGLFYQLTLKPVVSEAALRVMQSERSMPQRFAVNGPIHDLLSRLLPLIEALPVMRACMIRVSPLEAQDPAFVFSHHGYDHEDPSSVNTAVGELPARVWVNPATPKGASSRHTFEVAGLTPTDLGWGAAEKLAPHEDDLRTLLLAFDFAYSRYEQRVSSAKGLARRAKDWTLFVPEDEKLFARCETFAIYNLESQGFLNDKGRYVPLGGARTFETAIQAARTVTARKLSNVVVMRLKTQVMAVDPVLPVPGDMGNMGAALAALEGEVLRETLRRAKEEELLAQLEVLRAEHPLTAPVEPSRPTRRRM